MAYGNVHIQVSAGAAHAGTTRAGWTAGAGIEYAFTKNVSARVEYLYVDLGSDEVPCATIAGACGMNTQTFTESLFRGGLDFHL